LNKNNIVAGFIYKQVSCHVVLRYMLRILTSSTIRSWINNDEGADDCSSRSISARLLMNVFHVAWGNII